VKMDPRGDEKPAKVAGVQIAGADRGREAGPEGVAGGEEGGQRACRGTGEGVVDGGAEAGPELDDGRFWDVVIVVVIVVVVIVRGRRWRRRRRNGRNGRWSRGAGHNGGKIGLGIRAKVDVRRRSDTEHGWRRRRDNVHNRQGRDGFRQPRQAGQQGRRWLALSVDAVQDEHEAVLVGIGVSVVIIPAVTITKCPPPTKCIQLDEALKFDEELGERLAPPQGFAPAEGVGDCGEDTFVEMTRGDALRAAHDGVAQENGGRGQRLKEGSRGGSLAGGFGAVDDDVAARRGSGLGRSAGWWLGWWW